MNMSDGTIFFAAFTFRDFFAVDDDVARCLDADAHLCSVDGHYRDFHVVTDS